MLTSHIVEIVRGGEADFKVCHNRCGSTASLNYKTIPILQVLKIHGYTYSRIRVA